MLPLNQISAACKPRLGHTRSALWDRETPKWPRMAPRAAYSTKYATAPDRWQDQVSVGASGAPTFAFNDGCPPSREREGWQTRRASARVSRGQFLDDFRRLLLLRAAVDSCCALSEAHEAAGEAMRQRRMRWGRRRRRASDLRPSACWWASAMSTRVHGY